ncbi:MAG TPA: acyl-CoA dehydrogenase family protein [Acidimicrobiia bacterium]|nr:acyl-CoA dehydrogenase family protein [Acidimicrobiia bacterium]
MTSTIEHRAATDTPEEAAFRADVRAFLDANSVAKRERSPWALTYHTDQDAARQAFDDGRAWQGTRYAAGMTGFTYPKEVGGQGGDAWQERIYEEEAAQYEASSGFIRSTIMMLGPTLMAFGTDEQKRELIPRLLSGEDAWCQLFSEPGAGSDLASLACRAVRDGDEFVITGQKVWNSAAQWCDHGMLLARTNPDVPKHHGITFFLVDMRSPGIEVRPLIQPTGASHFNEVFFDNVRVPVTDVLGDIDNGWPAARTVMANESAMIGGSSNTTFANLVRLAQTFDRTGDPVARQRLLECYVRERTLGLLADRIMGAIRRRERPPVDPSILKLSIALNKAVSGNVAVELAGAAALQTDDEIGRWVGSELMSRYGISIGGGTNEVQRNNLAERALGLPKEPTASKDTPWSQLLRS